MNTQPVCKSPNPHPEDTSSQFGWPCPPDQGNSCPHPPESDPLYRFLGGPQTFLFERPGRFNYSPQRADKRFNHNPSQTRPDGRPVTDRVKGRLMGHHWPHPEDQEAKTSSPGGALCQTNVLWKCCSFQQSSTEVSLLGTRWIKTFPSTSHAYHGAGATGSPHARNVSPKTLSVSRDRAPVTNQPARTAPRSPWPPPLAPSLCWDRPGPFSWCLALQSVAHAKEGCQLITNIMLITLLCADGANI